MPLFRRPVSASLIAAKGDLIVGGGVADPERLIVGADATILTADATATYGVKWATSPSALWSSTTGVALSITNTAAATTLYTVTIPGGTLGENGGVAVALYGTYLNNSGSNRTITLDISYGGTSMFADVTANLGQSASLRAWMLDMTIGGRNATNAQSLGGTFSVSALASATAGTGDFNTADTLATRTFFGTAAVDSTVDRSFTVTFTHSTNNANLTVTRQFAHSSKL